MAYEGKILKPLIFLTVMALKAVKNQKRQQCLYVQLPETKNPVVVL